jgi:hypothetical protein
VGHQTGLAQSVSGRAGRKKKTRGGLTGGAQLSALKPNRYRGRSSSWRDYTASEGVLGGGGARGAHRRGCRAAARLSRRQRKLFSSTSSGNKRGRRRGSLGTAGVLELGLLRRAQTGEQLAKR